MLCLFGSLSPLRLLPSCALKAQSRAIRRSRSRVAHYHPNLHPLLSCFVTITETTKADAAHHSTFRYHCSAPPTLPAIQRLVDVAAFRSTSTQTTRNHLDHRDKEGANGAHSGRPIELGRIAKSACSSHLYRHHCFPCTPPITQEEQFSYIAPSSRQTNSSLSTAEPDASFVRHLAALPYRLASCPVLDS